MALVEESTAARLQQQARDHLWLHFTRMGGYREVDVTGLFAVQLGYSYGDEIGAAAHAQMKELPFYTNWSYLRMREALAFDDDFSAAGFVELRP